MLSLSLSKTEGKSKSRSRISLLMAVEARHFNLFPQQLLQERDLVNPSHQINGISAYDEAQMCFPAIQFPAGNQGVHQQLSINTESGLTCNISASRKRCRDSADDLYPPQNFPATQKSNSVTQIPSFVGENVLPLILHYQMEIDAIISQHTKKIKLELQERQKQQTKLMVAAIGEGAMKKLKEKDDQIQKMVKLNLVLQERVKSLYVENHLWRDLAQTNEATAISLRTNLEQALAQVGSGEHISAAVEEEVESCCGSSDQGEGGVTAESNSDRRCRRCGEREAGVLVLPCRHLCLCNVCGSGSHQLQTCPVCNSSMTATLHVNMSL